MNDAAAAAHVVWKPWPGFQTKALACGTFEALFGGAAGPGKTDVLIASAARYCQHPATRGLFLRTNYTDLQDVRDRMGKLYPALGATWEAEPRRWRWPSGASLELGYGESVAEISRYLGREYTAVLFDELGLVSNELVWTLLSSRVRSTDPTVPLRMRGSANPGQPGHSWLKTRFVDATKNGTRIFTDPKTARTRAYVPGTAKDNPSLPPDYWEGLSGLPPSYVAALRDGDWNAGLGVFFPEVAGVDGDRRLVTPMTPGEVPSWWDFWGGYDWGFRHPAVYVACARDGHDIVHVMDTMYLHRHDDDEQAATIKGLGADHPAIRNTFHRVYAGHDAFHQRRAHTTTPVTVADIFDRHHVYLTRASIDRRAGSQVLRRLLLTHKLVLWDTPGNRRLLDELRALVPDRLNAELPRKQDADPDRGTGGDDGPDALRYALASAPFLVTEPGATPATGDDPTLIFDESRDPVTTPGDPTQDQPYPEDFFT